MRFFQFVILTFFLIGCSRANKRPEEYRDSSQKVNENDGELIFAHVVKSSVSSLFNENIDILHILCLKTV